MRFIGIDPGISGALALIKDTGEVRAKKVPTIKVKVTGRKKKTRKDFDIKGCKELLESFLGNRTKVKIFIEGVHPFLASKVSNFNLGRSRGIWEGIVTGIGLKYELISPMAWKNYFFPLKNGKRREKHKKKIAAVKLVKKLYPSVSKHLKLVKDTDKADAILLAEKGRRDYYGTRNNKRDRNRRRS